MRLAVQQFLPSNRNVTYREDIILIHGTGAKGQMWQPQIELLTALGYRCIVPDLRGHGSSREPGEPTDIVVHVQDMLDTLAHIDVHFPAIFVGHSLGSIISVEMAVQIPDMFSKILAVSLPPRVPAITTSVFRWFLGWPYQYLKKKPLSFKLGWRERVLLETELYSLTQVADNFANVNYLDRLPKVGCPIHLAVGRFDTVALCYLVTKLHKALPNSTLQIIEWAGHNCMDTRPHQFNKWFLEKVTTG